MTSEELMAARESYSYVPARLVTSKIASDVYLQLADRQLFMCVPEGWENGSAQIRAKYSSIALDQFHFTLLNSDHDNDLMHGLLSVVFWGFASGTKNRLTSNRAFERARWVLEGKKCAPRPDERAIVNNLKAARALVRHGQIDQGLLEVMKIKNLGMSFASKVITFINPEISAVYDKVISLALEKNPTLTDMFVCTSGTWEGRKKIQADTYAKWCRWCVAKSNALNGEQLRWKDWDGLKHPWRAVDVERACFALGHA